MEEETNDENKSQSQAGEPSAGGEDTQVENAKGGVEPRGSIGEKKGASYDNAQRRILEKQFKYIERLEKKLDDLTAKFNSPQPSSHSVTDNSKSPWDDLPGYLSSTIDSKLGSFKQDIQRYNELTQDVREAENFLVSQHDVQSENDFREIHGIMEEYGWVERNDDGTANYFTKPSKAAEAAYEIWRSRKGFAKSGDNDLNQRQAGNVGSASPTNTGGKGMLSIDSINSHEEFNKRRAEIMQAVKENRIR